MKSQSGFTLIEAMLGMMVLLTAASFIAPAFTRDLILGRVQWERRLAMKTIESELEWSCSLVGPPNPDTPTDATNPDYDENGDGTHQPDFDELMGVSPVLVTPFPSELQSPTGSRVVVCVDANLMPATPVGMNLDGSCPDSDTDADALPETMKRVIVTVNWMSRGRPMSETSSAYFISRTGICSTGS